ncbi:MAG: aminoacyl-tRNA hydrolase [Bacteriovoracaceae bacterium]|nr:aminoacyl-tRNA hydrolase [Bacteriovoracaceae bacterium]
MQKLIVGAGNPGRKYSTTRHNIGRMVLEHSRFYSELKWQSKFKGQYSSISKNGSKIFFLTPETFMNLSGESVLALAQFFKILPADILVIHDELDLPFGTVALKNGGGLAGHNGLRSIANCLGTQSFKRLRLGIGRPQHGTVSSYVLSPFSKDESMLLDDYLSIAADAIDAFITDGFEKTARTFSKKSIINNI